MPYKIRFPVVLGQERAQYINKTFPGQDEAVQYVKDQCGCDCVIERDGLPVAVVQREAFPGRIEYTITEWK